MKIFITGGSGLIGQYINRQLAPKHEIVTQYKTNPGNCTNYNSIRFDICDEASLGELFKNFRPDLVIHTAAVSSAERADSMMPETVYNINVNATKRIAEYSQECGARLIYLSTDLVYAGYRGSLLDENAKLIPISLYAETKLMGEVKIRETFDNYVILRQALVFGFGLNHSRCHFHLMYEYLRNKKPVKLFTNQFRSPISLFDCARLIEKIAVLDLRGETINFGGPERLSRYQMGEALCRAANLDNNLLVPITMEEAGIRYKVADVSMNSAKLNSFGLKCSSLNEALKEILTAI